MTGYVYVMSNPAYKSNLVKIGKTIRDPAAFRATELYETGVPEAFKCEYWALVDDHDSVERNVFNYFNEKRPNINREFFEVTVPEAILGIRNNAEILTEKVFYVSPQELQRQVQEESKNLKKKRDAADAKRERGAALAQQKQREIYLNNPIYIKLKAKYDEAINLRGNRFHLMWISGVIGAGFPPVWLFTLWMFYVWRRSSKKVKGLSNKLEKL